MDLIVNFDCPKDVETYKHRIGRTARFGKVGFSLVVVNEEEMSFLTKNSFKINEIAEDFDFGKINDSL